MKYSTIAHPTKDDPDREWTCYYVKETSLFNSWFLNEMDWQPTLSKKIKRWLELEYKMFFEPRTSRPKCPTPFSTIRWHLEFTVWHWTIVRLFKEMRGDNDN